MAKITIRYISFPETIHGIIKGVTEQQYGRYLVLIDARNTKEQQDSALRHELAHIALNHFADTLPLSEVIESGGHFGNGWIQREKDADLLADQMTVHQLMNICT